MDSTETLPVKAALGRNVRNFLLSLVISIVLMKLAKPTPDEYGPASLFASVALISIVGYLLNVFRLAKELDGRKSTVWTILIAQIIPIIGVPIAISMVFKSLRKE